MINSRAPGHLRANKKRNDVTPIVVIARAMTPWSVAGTRMLVSTDRGWARSRRRGRFEVDAHGSTGAFRNAVSAASNPDSKNSTASATDSIADAARLMPHGSFHGLPATGNQGPT